MNNIVYYGKVILYELSPIAQNAARAPFYDIWKIMNCRHRLHWLENESVRRPFLGGVARLFGGTQFKFRT